MTFLFDIVLGGVFHAAVLFLVAAGLQIVFGVQKIINLACGSFYALGAYFGVSAMSWALAAGMPAAWFLPALLFSGVFIGVVVGPVVELMLRPIYDRDESFQLILTFALVLVFQDVFRYFWGANPQHVGDLAMAYGKVGIGEVELPTYNVLVIIGSVAIAIALGQFLRRTRYGRILRAAAENRAMSEALGIDIRMVNVVVFTLGTVLGTVGGAFVVPTAAASLDMAVELVVEAFAVVVIGGLGSMRGVLVGALIVGLMRAGAIAFYSELELLSIYIVVILILILRPSGLFGKPAE